MNTYRQLHLPDMDRWSVDQILAVYELCQTISATLMLHHEQELIDRMMEIDQRCEQRIPNPTLPLPFDDPF
ncbi:hypothetical protein AB833_28540 [Chromatiales bacterium (ex Bugula neritina AB1)]|nr:hypothetical protein AB833_28540 [Chromatiales bacterium (ex Bugula neritina AB1)]